MFYLFENEESKDRSAFGNRESKNNNKSQKGAKEFSLRDINQLTQVQLSEMIFAFDKNAAKDVTQMT